MPFNDRTPESLVSRADSKNPATTCRGITSNGRPCRRALASQKLTSITRVHTGLTSITRVHTGVLDPTVLYCWQHRDQASTPTSDIRHPTASQHARPDPIQERSSLDSLVGRLGIMSMADLSQQNKNYGDPRARYSTRYHQHRTDDHAVNHGAPRRKPVKPTAGPPASVPSEKPLSTPRKKLGFWASLCCMTSQNDDDYYEIVRHKQRIHNPAPQTQYASRPEPPQSQPSRPNVHPRPLANSSPSPTTTRPSLVDSSISMPLRRPMAELSSQRTNMRTMSAPDTRHLLSFIPRRLSPQTTSALLSELSKPISPHDEEGYIYIFWLTDTNITPSEDAAASLLAPPTPRRNRRPSDVMSEYSHTDAQAKNTIKLKIGRANNVHRRMNEWTRQCGYNLSLVRFYPYVPSTNPSPAASPVRKPGLYPDLSRPAAERLVSDQVRKVQHAHRVERLIHLELAGCRVKKDCQACGKEHREWFEIDATETGVKGVDEVIRRWVRWAETAERAI